ncbi:MAG: hypothetical protein MZV70_58665 [Desulfobacterales bacterium]|nr:hypothetical protein [Desulfobacterales bacterium]
MSQEARPRSPAPVPASRRLTSRDAHASGITVDGGLDLSSRRTSLRRSGERVVAGSAVISIQSRLRPSLPAAAEAHSTINPTCVGVRVFRPPMPPTLPLMAA